MQDRDEEQAQPLLDSPSGNGHSHVHEPRHEPFWRRALFLRGGRKSPSLDEVCEEDGDEDEDEVDGRYGTQGWLERCRPWKVDLGWKEHAGSSRYVLVLLLGLGLGAGLTLAWEHRPQLKSGPIMVPPVYTLPPPTGLPRNPADLHGPGMAAVASEDVTCSNLGLKVLEDMNGTAVDAAITSTLCVGVLNAFSAGIGGGGFALVRVPAESGELGALSADFVDSTAAASASASVIAIDFRETSPAASTKDMYKSSGRISAQVGGLAIAVPGELRGLEAAHKLYGRVPWRDLVLPVAQLARGWQVSRELARRIRIFGAFMLDDPTWAAVYAPRGQLLVEGEWVQRDTYADTLVKIAEEGPGAFYSGSIADSIAKTVQDRGGIITTDDLANYSARVYPAIHQTFRNTTIYTTDAPSSGGVMMGLLNILEPFDVDVEVERESCWDEERTHRFIEAMKFAFGARSEVTDPAFATNLTRLAEFRSKAWADSARSKLTDRTHAPDYYGFQHDTPIDSGTTHLSVVDKWGGAASVTSTVNLIWGSHVMCPQTGIIFNDEQDDFSLPGAADAFGLLPSPWNYPAPGKRALSSTAPTVVHDANGALKAVMGGSGGSRIFTSIAQVILNLGCGLDISEAIERPRVHNQLSPPITTVEVGPEGTDDALLDGLRRRGHEIGLFDINVGAAEVQAVFIDDDGNVWASSDSRKNGVSAAY